jgi:membrane-associated phospholipid phosphatase
MISMDVDSLDDEGDTSANVIQKGGTPQQRIRSLFGEPRSAALCVLAIYLGGTAALFSTSARHTGLVALHATAIAVIAWTLAARGPAATAIGDLLPLILSPLLYAEIPALIVAAGTTYHDAAIQALELRYFGAQVSRELAVAIPSLALSELLHAGYLAYYPAIFVPPLLLYLRKRPGFAETVFALTATYLICWIVFGIAPVEGPRYLWGPAVAAPDGPMRRLANGILAAGSSRGAAFPSSHVAVMVVQTVLAWRWQRRVSLVLAVTTLLVAVGSVYGGFHYATDAVVGAALGLVVGIATLFWFSKRGTSRAV